MTGFYSEQALYSSLVAASPLPAAIYTGENMLISIANPGMLGCWQKDQTIIGSSLKTAVPDFASPYFLQQLDNVYVSGKPYEAKEVEISRLIDHQQHTFYYNFTFSPLKDAEGQTHAILHLAADVTDLVKARHEIALVEERLSFALQSAEIGTWDLDPVHNIVKWDKRCQELFGFPENAEIPYAETLSCIHPLDLERVAGAVTAALQPHNKGKYEIRYRTIRNTDREIRWILCKGRAYFDEQGIACRFAGTAQDITAEVQSRLREQQLFSLVNHNADHMSVADMEGNLIYMNLAARKLLGVSRDMDVTTLKASDFYTKKELKRVQQQLIKRISPSKGWKGIIHLMNRETREEIPCQVSYMLITDQETGEVLGRGATARDLREEIKAKADLQRLATIVEISEDFCNYCDLDGNTIYINSAGIALLGFDKEKITATSLFDYHSDTSSAALSNVIMPQLLKTGKWSGPLELLHQQTGEIIPIHKQLFIIREEVNQQPVAIAGIARDLRPELNARKALDFKNTQLHIAVKELQFLANSVPAVVWTSGPDGKLDYISQRWTERAPLTNEAALGSGWAQTLHPDDEQRSWIAWRECLKTGDPFHIEFRLKDKNNEYRWWYVQALALKDEYGNILKWYGSNTDITDHKQLEQQKDNFLGVASHELKTPVTSIKAYTQVMEMMFRRAGDIKNADLLSKMDNQIDRLNTLIGDLLEVTKINTGRLEFKHLAFDFQEMAEEAIEDVQRTSLKHKIISALDFKRTITGDRERICQVITNLLTNAIKYSPDADQIFVCSEDLGRELKFSVKDLGIGIHPEEKDKIFGQFYRVSGSREHTFPGLGLGLYISAEIIKHLNGKIWVDSVEGKGSTFSFTLPAIEP